MKTKENYLEHKIVVEISRVLCESGWKPFTCKSPTHKIKRGYEKFSTLKELKEYYNIKKLIKTGEKRCAISPKGKRHEWNVYKAEISMEYAA